MDALTRFARALAGADGTPPAAWAAEYMRMARSAKTWGRPGEVSRCVECARVCARAARYLAAPPKCDGPYCAVGRECIPCNLRPCRDGSTHTTTPTGA